MSDIVDAVGRRAALPRRHGVDKRDAHGAGLLAIFAEFEREILRERTRAGLAQARQNGKRLGRRPRRSMRIRLTNPGQAALP